MKTLTIFIPSASSEPLTLATAIANDSTITLSPSNEIRIKSIGIEDAIIYDISSEQSFILTIEQI